MTRAPDAARFRWLVLAVFLLSTSVNFLDRQIFSVLGPTLEDKFHIDKLTFGLITSIGSAAYALSAPWAGLMIDRIGLTLGTSLALGLWSCAGIATGFTRGLTGLIGCRTVLSAAEGAGIPSAGKAIQTYLKPSERAMGHALNQAAVSLGLSVAPPLAAWIALRYSWQSAFIVPGVLGLAWIPLWKLVAPRGSAERPAEPAPASHAELWRDRRLWIFVAANALTMVGYSLWTLWTTFYLTEVHKLSLREASYYAWIPPLAPLPASFVGGWYSAHCINGGMAPRAARFRVCLICAVLSVGTLSILMARTPAWATAGIALSFGAVAAMSTNVYSLPLDTFGNARAASAISALVASYGAMQFVVAPSFGWIIQHYGYAPLMWIAAFTPALACVVLWRSGTVR